MASGSATVHTMVELCSPASSAAHFHFSVLTASGKQYSLPFFIILPLVWYLWMLWDGNCYYCYSYRTMISKLHHFYLFSPVITQHRGMFKNVKLCFYFTKCVHSLPSVWPPAFPAMLLWFLVILHSTILYICPLRALCVMWVFTISFILVSFYFVCMFVCVCGV